MKRIFRIYFIILIITMLLLCSCNSGNHEKMNTSAIDVSESTTPSNETTGTDDTIFDEDSQHTNPTEPTAADASESTPPSDETSVIDIINIQFPDPPTEYITEDGGTFSFEELEKDLECFPKWDDEIFSKSSLKEKIETFDDACEYAKDILNRGRKVFLGSDWKYYIVQEIQRDDKNNLWAAFLMTEIVEIDGYVIIGGNHVTVFDDYGEIIGIWYQGS